MCQHCRYIGRVETPGDACACPAWVMDVNNEALANQYYFAISVDMPRGYYKSVHTF